MKPNVQAWVAFRGNWPLDFRHESVITRPHDRMLSSVNAGSRCALGLAAARVGTAPATDRRTRFGDRGPAGTLYPDRTATPAPADACRPTREDATAKDLIGLLTPPPLLSQVQMARRKRLAQGPGGRCGGYIGTDSCLARAQPRLGAQSVLTPTPLKPRLYPYSC